MNDRKGYDHAFGQEPWDWGLADSAPVGDTGKDKKDDDDDKNDNDKKNRKK